MNVSKFLTLTSVFLQVDFGVVQGCTSYVGTIPFFCTQAENKFELVITQLHYYIINQRIIDQM